MHEGGQEGAEGGVHQQAAVLVHEELLGAVDIHQHAFTGQEEGRMGECETKP